MSDLLRRREATEATLARFRGRPLDWKTVDCVRMVRWHLVQMGHRPPPMPRYGTALGARRALAKAGGLTAIFDRLLTPIAPAALWVGDVAVLEGDEGMDAAMICVGQKLAGFHQDSDVLVNVTAERVKGAWRG